MGGQEYNKDSMFVIDFGLAKYYKNLKGEHIPF
jgi:hypothetical protein